jgi:hypothetical protein
VTPRLLLIALTATTAACGARSNLEAFEVEATSATGGSTSSGVGASGGGGASGGAGGRGPCSSVVLPERSFDLENGEVGRAPQLVATSLDGRRVSLLMMAAPEPILLDSYPELRQVTFDDAWDDWSEAPLGTPKSLGGTIGFRAPHQPGDGLTAWVSASSQATGPLSYYLDEVDPTIDDPPSTILLGFAPPITHATVPRLGSASVGYVQTGQTVLGLASPAGMIPVFTDLCPLPAPTQGITDAVAVNDGFLVAAARPMFVGCDLPTDVSVFRHEVGELPVEVFRHGSGGLLSHVFMRPRAGGAWLLFVRLQDASQQLEAMALDEAGEPLGEPLQVELPPLFEPGTLTVSAYGDGFAYAVLTSDSGEVGSVEVRTFDADGAGGLAWSLVPAASPRPLEPLSLLPGPDGEALLLAWSSFSLAPTIAGNAQIYASRLSCR